MYLFVCLCICRTHGCINTRAIYLRIRLLAGRTDDSILSSNKKTAALCYGSIKFLTGKQTYTYCAITRNAPTPSVSKTLLYVYQ